MRKIIVSAVVIFVYSVSSFASDARTFEKLKFIQNKIGNTYYKINKTEAKIKKTNSKSAKDQLEKLKKQLEQSRTQFYSTASGINFTAAKVAAAPEKKKLFDQLQELLNPLFDAIRKLSEAPRQIQQLEDEKEKIQEKIVQLSKGLKNLDDISNKNENDGLNLLLKQSKRHLQDTSHELKIKSENIERILEEQQSSSSSIWDKFIGVVKNFLGTKGRNLFLAFVVFVGFCWFFRYFRKYIFRLPFFYGSFEWARKPMKALYGISSAITALFFAILCLYLLNDWVLVTLTVLIVSSILWSLKQYTPKFVEEIRLILNLGTVREGQRIIWKGVPWKVQTIGLYSSLINEDLLSKPVKVAASELLKEHSRPVVDDEPWFPSRKGDWIILADGSFGQVMLQTPEQVVVQLLGGGKKYYPTPTFLAATPLNLSQGFRIEVTFGLDYGTQSLICKEILEIVKSSLKEKLDRRMVGVQADFADLTVSFHSAGESSLNLWIKADCRGHVAFDYYTIQREIQTAMVEICNENSYVIPFNQLTVHMQK